MIELTESARTKILDILYDEGKPDTCLRTFVQGGGCSGFQYGFTLDEVKNEDDFEVEVGPFRVLIDAMSMQYMIGATIDYKEELMGSSFVINNPNAQSSCGCGSSFTV
jgi:iron-sulfur cluster insertion protein